MFKSNLLKIITILAICLAVTVVFTSCADKVPDDPSVGSEKPYDYDLSGFITLGQYKGIEIGPYDLSVSAEELQTEIDGILQYYTQTETISEGTAASGDTVNIDYVGTIDGVEFLGGASQGYNLTLGSNSFITGFESGIVGHSVGETFTISVTFPEEYHSEDLAGQDAEFEVTINSIIVFTPPAYTDEFVNEKYEGYSTTAELEASLRAELSAEKEANLLYTKMDDALRTVLNNSEIKAFPQGEIDRCVEQFYAEYTEEAAAYELTLEEYVVEAGITIEDFDAYAKQSAENTVIGDLLMYSIARAENITISDEEYSTLLAEYIDPASGDVAAGIADLEAQYGKELLVYSLMCDKVYEFLVANAVELGA
jgi:trigger factor